jgi:hypothetical protein
MVSERNLVLLEDSGIKYISAMDRSQLEGVTGLNFSMFSHLEPERVNEQAGQLPDFTKLNDVTYYREVKVPGCVQRTDREAERRYILCFNPELFKDQRKARSQAIEDFRTFVDDLNIELSAAKNSRQRNPTYDRFNRRLVNAKLADFVAIRLHLKRVKGKTPAGAERKTRTYQATVVVDNAKLLLPGRLDGFWLLVTNHTEKGHEGFKVSTQDAIIPYRDRVVIESAFRDIKSFVEVAPVYLWTEAHVKAHYTICVLSHLINRTLTLRLHEHKGHVTREIVSHEKLYEKLSDCQIDRIEVQNARLSTHNMTRLTDTQRELLGRVGLMNIIGRETVEKARASKHNYKAG